jgi:hypothetical protein
MDHVQPVHTADRRGERRLFLVAQPVGAGNQSIGVVDRIVAVDRSCPVPPRAVYLQRIAFHARIVVEDPSQERGASSSARCA